MLDRMGSEAAPAQCRAVAFPNKVSWFFPSNFVPVICRVSPDFPRMTLINSARRVPQSVAFSTTHAEVYRNKILDYAGSNSNVITWAEYRRPKNRIAQYFDRIVNKFETGAPVDVSPFYITYGDNIFRDDLSRLPIQLSAHMGIEAGYSASDISLPLSGTCQRDYVRGP